MKIGDEVYIHGYVDEIRQNVVIIRNDGGYFGTVAEEITSCSEIPNTCGDAISRQAVFDAMYELCSTGETLKENPWRDNPHIDAITDAIENLPSVSPQQSTGRWIEHFDEIGKWYECDQCHTDWGGSVNFCPNCGAKMEVEE